VDVGSDLLISCGRHPVIYGFLIDGLDLQGIGSKSFTLDITWKTEIFSDIELPIYIFGPVMAPKQNTYHVKFDSVRSRRLTPESHSNSFRSKAEFAESQ